MNENLLRRIKSRLNANFYVMNDSWLRDCVEFFIEDKAPHEVTDEHILEFVEGQWQLSDLREISNENGCLPSNLVQQIHTVLTGAYILQVDKMYDIASSKYKQLCQIRKINSDNLEVTENEKPTEWEPKARRMMQWCLTDGVQNIAAIEYIPFKQMRGTLLPGYKVKIIGPVNCRRGIILLEDGKYREIGGEVESMLKTNALENILAKALNEPENPDPYHDNGLLGNQNNQNTPSNPTNEDNLFDDDFEEAVDLEEVTAIERQSQEAVVTVQNRLAEQEQRQDVQTIENDIAEEFFEDIDFEPTENRDHSKPNKDFCTRPLRASPSSRMETDGFEEDDVMMVEEISTCAYNSQGKRLYPTKSWRNEDIDFADDDFDDYKVIKTESRVTCRQQSGNSSKFTNETGMCPSPQTSVSKLTNVTKNVEKYTSVGASPTRNGKSVASTSRTVEETPKAISNFFPPPPTICGALSDVLHENITVTRRRTVRAKVKTHSALTKQGKCWVLTALIADHTSNVEVCFDSEILEKFLGFTVKEFSHKKKLAKSDTQVKNELRLSLRKAQHQIENLDASLTLELTRGQMPKVVGITEQKEKLVKRAA